MKKVKNISLNLLINGTEPTISWLEEWIVFVF
jgi:hypothetical protein